MKKPFAAIAGALALCIAGAAQAAVLNFDEPGVIDIDPMTSVATLTENGFAFSGPAATFLPLDSALIGGIDGATPLTLASVGGGSFALQALDYAFYDLGFGANPGLLSVTGLLNGLQVASQSFNLGAASAMATFGAGFGNVTQVVFSGTTAFALDNVDALAVAAPIPEPATVALTAVGLLALALRARRRAR